MTPLLKFLLSVAVLTAMCAGLEYWWNLHAAEEMKFSNGYLMLGIFAVSVVAVHSFLLQSSKGEPKAFVNKFMAATFIKLFFYMFVLVFFLFLTETNKKALALHFLFFYAVYTVLEVSMLISALKKK